MPRMVRKQVYIEPRHEQLLKSRAKELGVSEAELIRRGIEHATQAAAPRFRDIEAWERIKDFIKTHRMLDVPQTSRTWTREELYEERLGRFAR